MPGPALRSPSARAGQIAREIDRDERVVLLALGRRLAALLRAALDHREAANGAVHERPTTLDHPATLDHPTALDHPTTLDHPATLDLTTTLDAMTAAVARAAVQARTLNDARITRRAERPQLPGERWVPPELRAHACHGDYLGDFADLAAVGRMAFRTCLIEPALEASEAPSPRDLALALHLRGSLWTIEHGGRVHVFRCRGAQSGSQSGR